MPPLDPSLRNKLENVIVEARELAEESARAALVRLAVPDSAPFPSMDEEQRRLRRALRAKSRQLGDPLGKPLEPGSGGDDLTPALVQETAYEKWHQMLFAAFLAKNNLLIYPDSEVAVTLAECAELAPDMGLTDAWTVAASFASKMLPGIFSLDDPSTLVEFAPDERIALERLIEAIPEPVFTSDDGLGWVYQFWQTQRKKDVNASGRKIGGADLAPVTQLFTEHYMVQFLLHNTLGAWWVSRHPDKPLPTDKSYLRTLDDGAPAAGQFKEWPDRAADMTIMDPCCGSGHFLVAAFALMQRFRMHEEGLSAREAGDAVIRDNLHGLELDPRCTQLAAFNLAMEAWKSGGYRELPPMNIACSGVSVGGTESDWTHLAGEDIKAVNALKYLHHMFKNAPDLGSLMDPTRLDEQDRLYTAAFTDVERLLDEALSASAERTDPVAQVFGDAARGMTRAAELLRRKYTVVVTNVPYLARGKQGHTLKDYLGRIHPLGKADLATAFVERCRTFTAPGGTYALVTPQNWLFLGSYKKLRKDLLIAQSWNLVARLGTGAFETISGEVVNVALVAITNSPPAGEHVMVAIDVSAEKRARKKAHKLPSVTSILSRQVEQLANPDARIIMIAQTSHPLLHASATIHIGIQNNDVARHILRFWELDTITESWRRIQLTHQETALFLGRQGLLRWAEAIGGIGQSSTVRISGTGAWGKSGVAIRLYRQLPATLYAGDAFDQSISVIVPNDPIDLPALWEFCSSPKFHTLVRELDRKVNVTPATLGKVPFDSDYWTKRALAATPRGLPEPYSVDPTQWLYKGEIKNTHSALHVATARLLGYSWPEQPGSGSMKSGRPYAASANDGAPQNGVLCIPPVAGELAGVEQLQELMTTEYSTDWSRKQEAALIASTGSVEHTLEAWLNNDFFSQHARLFGQRPFLWHITDGRKDGFSALVNYHKLDRAKLERLIYTYLGSYIQQVQEQVNADVRGAELRLKAAQDLKEKLELILIGEPPYDIYVRWKPLHEQPIGWDPDLNDGVRLNIRPWVTAGVLRSRFPINWNKDRGLDPKPNASGTRERHNDLHFTRAQKEDAREANEKAAPVEKSQDWQGGEIPRD